MTPFVLFLFHLFSTSLGPSPVYVQLPSHSTAHHRFCFSWCSPHSLVLIPFPIPSPPPCSTPAPLPGHSLNYSYFSTLHTTTITSRTSAPPPALCKIKGEWNFGKCSSEPIFRLCTQSVVHNGSFVYLCVNYRSVLFPRRTFPWLTDWLIVELKPTSC